MFLTLANLLPFCAFQVTKHSGSMSQRFEHTTLNCSSKSITARDYR